MPLSTLEAPLSPDPYEAMLLAGTAELATHLQIICETPPIAVADYLEQVMAGTATNASSAERLAVFTVLKAEQFLVFDERVETEVQAFLDNVTGTTQKFLLAKPETDPYWVGKWAKLQAVNAKSWQIRHIDMPRERNQVIKTAEPTLRPEYNGPPRDLRYVFGQAAYNWVDHRIRYTTSPQAIVAVLDEAIHSPAEVRGFTFRHAAPFFAFLYEQADAIQADLAILPDDATNTPPEVLERVAAVRQAQRQLEDRLRYPGVAATEAALRQRQARGLDR